MAKWDPPHVICRVRLCLYAKILGLLLHSFFSAKVPFLAFLLQKGVWPYKYAYDIPLVTLILNICGFVGVAPFFYGKSTIFFFFFFFF